MYVSRSFGHLNRTVEALCKPPYSRFLSHPGSLLEEGLLTD